MLSHQKRNRFKREKSACNIFFTWFVQGLSRRQIHFLMSVPETESGIKPRLWKERLVGVLKVENRIN